MSRSSALHDLGDTVYSDATPVRTMEVSQFPLNSTIMRLFVSPYSFTHRKGESSYGTFHDCLSAVGSFISHPESCFRSHCYASTCIVCAAYCWSIHFGFLVRRDHSSVVESFACRLHHSQHNDIGGKTRMSRLLE